MNSVEALKKVLIEHKFHYTNWSKFPVTTFCSCGSKLIVKLPEDILNPAWNPTNENKMELEAMLDHQAKVFLELLDESQAARDRRNETEAT